MFRELNENEHDWLNKLLAAEFKGRHILKNQISKSKCSYEQEYAFISLKFNIKENVEKYPYQVRVPIEMRAFQEKSAPIVFLLHITDGLIYELEVFTADLSEIRNDTIVLEEVEYDISQEVI